MPDQLAESLHGARDFLRRRPLNVCRAIACAAQQLCARVDTVAQRRIRKRHCRAPRARSASGGPGVRFGSIWAHRVQSRRRGHGPSEQKSAQRRAQTGGLLALAGRQAADRRDLLKKFQCPRPRACGSSTRLAACAERRTLDARVGFGCCFTRAGLGRRGQCGGKPRCVQQAAGAVETAL